MTDGSSAEHKQLFGTWIEMWRNDACHHREVAAIVQRCLAETGDATYFIEAPPKIRADLLRNLRRFRKTGTYRVSFTHSPYSKDLSSEARAAISTLIRAGLVPDTFAEVAKARALFSGLDHVEGGSRLIELVACDHSLLSAKLISLGSHVRNAHEMSQLAKICIRVDRHVREYKDNDFFVDTPTRSCVADFSLHEPGPFYFSPCFSLEYIESFEVTPSQWQRVSGYEITLDFGHFDGSIICREISLERLEALEICPPG
jgi:hypothetical protein